MSSVATVRAPSAWLTALEVRAVGERAAMVAAMPLLQRLPGGDGHPVLVLPGFLADDRSTAPLRAVLRRLGYRSHGWGRLGSNLGPTPEIRAGLARRFDQLSERYQQPLSIVGWSLGGIYGRELARRRPELVRQVVTLGSPIQMMSGDRSASSALWESLHDRHDPTIERSVPESVRPVLPVPSTAVYTRTDGIVAWSTCLDRPGPTSENVEVLGSHCGLGFNPAVVHVVADRLSQPPDSWSPFRAPRWLRGLYPRPAQWTPRSL